MKKVIAGVVAMIAVVALGTMLLSSRTQAASAVIAVSGMNCGECVEKITTALQGLEGVQAAEVSLSEGVARVKYDAGATEVATLERAIANLGYGTTNFKAVLSPNHEGKSSCSSGSSTSGSDCCATQPKRSDT